MLSRFAMVLGCVSFCLSAVRADEYSGTLIKVADGQVVFARGTGKKKKEFSLPTVENCRVFFAKYNTKSKVFEAGDEIEGGVNNPIFKHLAKETIAAWIVTNAKNDTIRELRLFQTLTKKKSK